MRLRCKLFALFATLVLAVAGCGDDATDRLNGAVDTFADALNKVTRRLPPPPIG
jgi:hypothetical protein